MDDQNLNNTGSSPHVGNKPIIAECLDCEIVKEICVTIEPTNGASTVHYCASCWGSD